MLRRVIQRISQTIRSKKIRMAETVSSIVGGDRAIKAEGTTSMKRSHEEGDDGAVKKIKAEQDVSTDVEKKKSFRRKKMIIFLVYSGKGYQGMQRNPGAKTIEADLMEALLKAGLVTEEQAANPSKNYFQRAARTDKSVSAAGQLCSSMLCVDVENPVEKINQHLVEQIRVIGIQSVTKKFDSKNAATARTYMYILPTFAFAPCEVFVQESYRITDEVLQKVNETLKLFKGTRNFHNFTSGKKPSDPSATRYIMEFQIGQPFERSGLEFAVIKVKGQSFILHQIRKMIGLTIAIARGMTGPEAVQRAYGSAKCDVPKAPGLGLMLDRVHYDFYNRKFGNDGSHEPILWEKYTTEIEKFKEKFIYPTIIETESKERSMLDWMSTLHLHDYERVGDQTQTTPMGIAFKNIKALRKEQNEASQNTETEPLDEVQTATGLEESSAGVTMVTDQESSAGVTMVTDQGSSAGVSMVTDQESSAGVSMVTDQGSSAGVTMVTDQGSSAGVSMVTDQGSSAGVSMVTDQGSSAGVSMVTDQEAKLTEHLCETDSTMNVTDQSSIVANQSSIVANQSAIVANQSAIVENQSSIVANQSSIAENQSVAVDCSESITCTSVVTDSSAPICCGVATEETSNAEHCLAASDHIENVSDSIPQDLENNLHSTVDAKSQSAQSST